MSKKLSEEEKALRAKQRARKALRKRETKSAINAQRVRRRQK